MTEIPEPVSPDQEELPLDFGEVWDDDWEDPLTCDCEECLEDCD